jgi:hypothetical protein
MDIQNTSLPKSKRPTQEQIEHLFNQFHPIPSVRFYKMLEKAPWVSRTTRLAFTWQIAVAVGIVLTFFMASPSISDVFTPTDTPTATYSSLFTIQPTIAPKSYETPQPNIEFIPSPTVTPIG